MLLQKLKIDTNIEPMHDASQYVSQINNVRFVQVRQIGEVAIHKSSTTQSVLSSSRFFFFIYMYITDPFLSNKLNLVFKHTFQKICEDKRQS